MPTTNQTQAGLAPKSPEDSRRCAAAPGSELTENQGKALTMIGREWAKCPLGVRSATLLSLKDRRLIEGRVKPGCESHRWGPYTSFAYEWRSTQNT